MKYILFLSLLISCSVFGQSPIKLKSGTKLINPIERTMISLDSTHMKIWDGKRWILLRIETADIPVNVQIGALQKQIDNLGKMHDNDQTMIESLARILLDLEDKTDSLIKALHPMVGIYDGRAVTDLIIGTFIDTAGPGRMPINETTKLTGNPGSVNYNKPFRLSKHSMNLLKNIKKGKMKKRHYSCGQAYMYSLPKDTGTQKP